MSSRVNRALFSAAMMVVGAGQALAATQTVSNSFFSVVYEDNTRFGTLSLVGNAITFDLVNTASPAQPWIAESLNDGGTKLAVGSVALTLTINSTAWASGYRFGAFDWIEGGAYLRKEAGSTVGVQGQFRGFDGLAPFTTATSNGLALFGSGLNTVGSNTNWFATARIDATTPCAGPGCSNVILGQPQQIVLSIENGLSATSAAALNSQAFIEKKLGAGAFTMVVSPIPEASTWAMMGGGLALVGFLTRRLRSSQSAGGLVSSRGC